MPDELERKITNLENQLRQFLLRMNRQDTEIRDLQTKFRSAKSKLDALTDLTSNRKFG